MSYPLKELAVLCSLTALGFGPAEDAPAGGQSGPVTNPIVRIETTMGDIVLELDAERAPLTVANFIQYVEAGYYDGTVFHRVMKDYLIQGGLYSADMAKKTEGLRGPIKNEWENGLFHTRGSVAMARPTGSPDGAVSEFLINLTYDNALDIPQRDGAGYAVFGKVVEGMEVAEQIAQLEVTEHPNYDKDNQAVVPIRPPVMKSVGVVREFDRERLAARVREIEAAGTSAADRAKRLAQEMIDEHVRKVEAETGKKFVARPSGLRYLVVAPGAGPSPGPSQRVRVDFAGSVLGGGEFMNTHASGPKVYPVESKLRGWSEALQLMAVGARWKLVLPPDLGYGSAGRPAIPPNSVLLFDVELLEVLPD